MGLCLPFKIMATLAANLPRGLSVASITYQSRFYFFLFAMNVLIYFPPLNHKNILL